MKNENNDYDKIIGKVYDEYKRFLNNVALPDITYVWINSDEGIFAYFDAKELYNKTYKLYLNKNFFELYDEKSYKSHFCKELYKISDNKTIPQMLYHEFTHLADSLSFNKYDFETFDKLMFTYSEYNSSRIELMKSLDFKSEFEKVGIELSDTVTYYYKEMSVNDFFTNKINEYKNNVVVYVHENKYEIVRQLMYILGYISVSELFVDKFIPMLNEAAYIKEEALKIFNALYKKNIEDILEANVALEEYFLDFQARKKCKEIYGNLISDDDLQTITNKNYDEVIKNIIKK